MVVANAGWLCEEEIEEKTPKEITQEEEKIQEEEHALACSSSFSKRNRLKRAVL